MIMPKAPTCVRPSGSVSAHDRLIDTLMTQAFSALNASPDARASYDQLNCEVPNTTLHCAKWPRLRGATVGHIYRPPQLLFGLVIRGG